MMKIHATIGETTYILGVLRDSFSFTERCGDAGKHATSSVSCSVRPVDENGNNFGAAIFTAEGLVSAIVYDGTTRVFTGYIRPYVSASAQYNTAGNMHIEIMDPTESMHKYVWPIDQEDAEINETVYQNKTLAQNMTTLFGLVGKTCDTSALPSFTMPWFRLASGEYVDEIISDILFEYGYDYTWGANGTAEFYSTFAPQESVESIDDIRNTLSTSRSDDSTDGLKMTYSVYREEENVKIYNHSHKLSFDWWKLGSMGGAFAANLTGKYWNGTMHDSMFDYDGNASTPVSDKKEPWNFTCTGITDEENNPLSSSDVYFVEVDPTTQFKVWLKDEKGITLTPHFDAYDATGARFWIDYSGRFQIKWTWRIEVYGKVGYRTQSEVSFNITGESPEKLNLKYRLMLDGTVDEDVRQFCEKYAARSKASNVTYSFDSLTEYTVGGFYTLENDVEGRTQTVRITSRSKNADGIYTYKAEGAGSIGTLSISTEYNVVTPAAKQTSYDIAISKGFSGTEEEYIASLGGGPKYKGGVSSASAIPEGATGVCWLATSTFTTNGKTYRKNYPYYWDGSAWAEWDSINSENSSVMLKMLGDADGTSSDGGVYNWFKVLIAQSAVINELFANAIELGSSGYIKSKNYVSGTSGFKIDGNGNAEFIGLKMREGLVTGTSFECPTFTSKERDQNKTQYSTPSSNQQSTQWAYINQYIAPHVTDGAIYEASVSSDSNVKYMTKNGNFFFFLDSTYSQVGYAMLVSAYGVTSYNNVSTVFTVYVGGGHVFKFLNLPINADSCESGMVYLDPSTNNLKVKQ